MTCNNWLAFFSEVSMNRKHILCVDDEMTILTSLKNELTLSLRNEYKIELAESAEEGLAVMQEIIAKGGEVPLLISDQLMPGMKGDQFIIETYKLTPRTRNVMLTGQADATAVGNVINKASLFRFISKPWATDDLIMTVREAIASFSNEGALNEKIALLTSINQYAELMAQELDMHTWAMNLLQALTRELDITRILLSIPAIDETGMTNYQLTLESNQWLFEELSEDERLMFYPVGAFSATLEDQTPVVVGNAQIGEWSEDPAIRSMQTQSFYCSAICAHDKLFGYLFFDHNKKKNACTPFQVELLKAIEHQAALTMEKIILYATLAQRVQLITGDIQEENTNYKESIAYSQKLQKNLLPPVDLLQHHFPDGFVYFQPRDVLSGDFYWYSFQSELFVIACADCTGHGVPGAYLSLLGLNLVRSIVEDRQILEPEAILLALDQGIRKMLHYQEEESQLRDGMDIAVCVIDQINSQFRYSGANQSIIFWSGGEAKEIKADKVGINSPEPAVAFTGQTFHYEPGDALYLMSDGMLDQFDGENKSKFSMSRMRELIKACSKLAVAKQAYAIQNRMDIWKGKNQQTDDMLMIGISLLSK
jgi:serine phosphatase RsbU (regulator of sigma subunit)/FixJ family two-component response regulator